MAIAGIEVGAWKLEKKKTPIEVVASTELHEHILTMLSLLPRYGNHGGSSSKDRAGIIDLHSTNPDTEAQSRFSVRYDHTRFFERERTVNEVEMRFTQPVSLHKKLFVLTTIMHGDLTLHTPPVLTGGRKFRRMIAPPAAGIPEYRIQRDLLADVEDLCPVTDAGLVVRLAAMPDAIRAQGTTELRRFEEIATEVSLTA